MSNLSQTPSEARQGGICNTTRLDISQKRFNELDSELTRRKTEERLLENEKKYGRDSARIVELRKEGKVARLSAVPLDLTQFEKETDKNNYRAGFVEHGNRIILGSIENLSPEQLEAYGQNDYVSGIELREIPEAIKANTAYAQGYIMASIMGSTKGNKGR